LTARSLPCRTSARYALLLDAVNQPERRKMHAVSSVPGLVQAVSHRDEDTLQAGLRQLVAAELFYQRGRPPRARYVFKHALIQDAAYASLLKSTRQQVHQRIAQVLEGQFPEMVATQPELLAHHLSEAGHPAEAVGYWQRAGERAVARSANLEAISHLKTGLAVLQTLPETTERIQQELLLQTTLVRR
jgi:predicted ATPase